MLKHSNIKYLLNEPSKENIERLTPDKFFLEKGTNLVEAVKNMPLTNAFQKGDLEKIIAQVFKRYKTTETSVMLDKLKNLGFKHSTLAGITFSLSDITDSDIKEQVIEETNKTIEQINKQFKRGLITDSERHDKVVKLWFDAKFLNSIKQILS